MSDRAASSAVPLGYAPVAVTGFGIAYVADKPDNAGEQTSLRLTPRLLAKLLTQSYPASVSGGSHPGLEHNPLTINVDPEFTALNPGLSDAVVEARAALLSLSDSSDVMTALTSYIAADPDAMAFIGGKPDPWGMVVNPAYRDVTVPTASWPLLDTWVRPSLQECESQITTPYLSLVAAPVNSLRKIAEAVLDAWPNVQTRCTRSTTSDPWKIGRVERQGYGTRFMLGVVSLGDAERLGLRTAQLLTAGTGTSGTYVGPSPAAMAAAVASATQEAPGEPFTLDRATLPDDAYPGTMIVHVAARLSGLDAATAGHVSQFVDVATGEGQVPGSGNGQLPDGYLPITGTGPTAALLASARQVSGAFLRQGGSVVPAVAPVSTAPGPPSVVPPARASAATTTAVAAAPASVAGLPADAMADAAAPGATGLTPEQSSGAANAALPVTVGVGLAGLGAAPVLRLWTTRRRPV
ncbi:hypothetical protein [Cellulomonas soli]